MLLPLKCADCICDIEDCKVSESSFECPNCILDKCCCWENFHFSDNNNLIKYSEPGEKYRSLVYIIKNNK